MKIKEELRGVLGMEYGEMNINRGKKSIFEEIEHSSNILCAKGLIACAAITTVIGIIAVILDKSTYMQSVMIRIVIAVVVCVAMAWYSLKRKKHGSLHKYALFAAWSVAICMIASCTDSSESLLYAIPIMLAIRYYSVVFTLSVSVLNIIFAFIPYIIKVYIHAFPLDFVVLEEGTVITMAGDSLYGTVNALSTIDMTATITNMLSFGYLVTMSVLVVISIFAVMLTSFTRKNILTQYNASRNRMEGRYEQLY